MDITPDAITALSAMFVACLFAYFPVLRTKYAALTSEQKSLIMIGIILLIVVIVSVLGVIGVVIFKEGGQIMTWTPFPWWKMIMTFALTLATNQGTYKILPETQDVKEARLARQ